ncbi:MAG: AMP-binding protein [Burkholderiales bacterium]|jgi:long-chain acyl-CoA synthetase|nr:AMP-binding protein [Burkholderiales bacterium]
MNLAELLARAARVFPDNPAIVAGARLHATYRDFAVRAAALAGGFRDALELAPGDRIGLFMSNCPQYLEVLWAAWWAGLAAVPINAKLHPREAEYILEHSGARACFVTGDLPPPGGGRVATLERLIDVDSSEYRSLAASDGGAAIARCAPDDLAWLFYTSGTTGRPKGVEITHRNLMTMALCYLADVDEVAHGDAILHAAPMSHGSGIYCIPHVLRAAKQVVPESGGFDAGEIFDLVRMHDGAAMFAAPTMVKRLVEHARSRSPALDNLKTIVYGGGPMYLADIRDALSVMGQRFAQIYGQGESPMTITALSKWHHANDAHPFYDARLASVGVAQSAVEVRVAGEDGALLPAGETGEILVRGDSVMRGYWANPEATAATLAGGWLHTGDVGALDEDGFLTLKDRSKDLIISGGSNIYPREVEEVLLRHPGVAEASVVGEPHPEWGEQVVAFVVRAAGASLGEGELDRLCLQHIARFKRPKAYRFVDALPKNNYGKVLKTELRERLARERGAG